MNTPVPPSVPRHAVILAHPDPASFNAQVAQAYCGAVRGAGQEAVLRDLHALRFDPVLRIDEQPSRKHFTIHADVERELDLVAGCDVLTLVYPIWFGAAPAMLKGYVDRVLGSGVGPQALQEHAGNGLLNGCRLLSFTSSAARAPWLAEVGQESSLRSIFDHYLEHAFGMKQSEHVHFGGVVEGLSKRFVDEHLHEVEQRARRVCAAVAAERQRAKATGPGIVAAAPGRTIAAGLRGAVGQPLNRG